jgi:hypothetical protein
MSDLNDAIVLAERAVISWTAELTGQDPDHIMEDQDREELHELLMAFGKVCQLISPPRP